MTIRSPAELGAARDQPPPVVHHETPTRTTSALHVAARAGRVLLGLALIALTVLPVYRVLDPSLTGSAGDHARTRLDVARTLIWAGTALALIPAILAARLVGWRSLRSRLRAAADWIAALPGFRFATAAAVVATALALWFGLGVLEGKPNLIDAMAQLLHARYLAEGHLSGPAEMGEFWAFPNSLLTERGWVSQYPPGHPLLLALGLLVGAVWAVGPALLGVAIFFTALTADRLLPERRAVVRLAVLLAATSPFLIAHAGAYMNHTSAAAFTAAAIYFVIRARDGSRAWAVAAGIAASIALATRPLSALVMILGVALVAWGDAALAGRGLRWFAARSFAALAAALPLVGAHLWHNARFFGAPTRFGYIVAYGESHEMGFGQDPWGNRYGLLEATGYTSADLTLLSINLFETPLPLVAVVGAWLLLDRRLRTGERVLLAWAVLPVVANFFYWHHGIFMGPRMLNEAAPAWALLIGVSVAALVRRVPRSVRISGLSYSPRTGVTVALLVTLVASLALMAPRRLISYGGEYLESLRIEPPRPDGPSLVFVHGAWMGRVGSRLMAAGMRLDSLETVLRQNTTCSVHLFAQAYEGPAAALPPLDFAPRADRLPPSLELTPHNEIRVLPGEQLPPDCVREIRADTRGIIEVVPFLWRGDLPGLPGEGPLYVRDLGPERNRAMLRRHRDRRPYVFLTEAPEAPPVLLPYDRGMRLLWRQRDETLGPAFIEGVIEQESP